VTWFFTLIIVLLIGAVAVVASGRWGGMSEAYDDRPDMRVPANRVLVAEDIESSKFAVSARGYRMDEVDSLLERVAREVAERDRRIADLERAVTPMVQGPDGSSFATHPEAVAALVERAPVGRHAAPRPADQPALTPEPTPVAEPEPVVEPQPVAESEPVVEPQPVAEPEPVVEPQPGAGPELVQPAAAAPVEGEVAAAPVETAADAPVQVEAASPVDSAADPTVEAEAAVPDEAIAPDEAEAVTPVVGETAESGAAADSPVEPQPVDPQPVEPQPVEPQPGGANEADTVSGPVAAHGTAPETGEDVEPTVVLAAVTDETVAGDSMADDALADDPVVDDPGADGEIDGQMSIEEFADFDATAGRGATERRA